MAPVYKKKTVEEAVYDLNQETTISASISAGTTTLQPVEKISERVASPIMSNSVKELTPVLKIKLPDKALIKKVREEAGIKQRSNAIKETNRQTQAATKYLMQKRLYLLQQQPAAEYTQEVMDNQAEKLRTLDLSEMVFKDSGLNFDKNFLDNYDKIKANLACIDAFETKVVNARATLTEKDLPAHLESEAQLRTLKDIRSFYELRASLMANPYYSVLPLDKLLKTPYKDLLSSLDDFLDAEEKDYNLIDYYQTLIRLHNLGITDTKSVQARKAEYLQKLSYSKEDSDDRDGAEEIKKIEIGYRKLLEMLDDRKTLYSENEKKKYTDQFFAAHQKDIMAFDKFADKDDDFYEKFRLDYEHYLNSPKAEYAEETADLLSKTVGDDDARLQRRKSDEIPEGIEINEKQIEEMRKIQAFLLRRSCREKEKYGPFIHHFLQTPLEQQLTAFYLLETGREKVSMGSDFFLAINEYTPNLSNFKKMVRGRTFSLKWQSICDAVQGAKDLSKEMETYAQLITDTKNADESFEESKKGDDNYSEQGYKALDSIGYHLGVLEFLYRSAGMHKDMSPDMVKDEKLRARMFAEYRKIGDLAAQLEEISKKDPNFEDPESHVQEGETSEYKEKEGPDVAAGIMAGVGVTAYINTYPNLAMANIQKIAKATNNMKLLMFLGNKDVAASGASFTAISSICTGILSTYGMYKLWNKEGLTSADKAAQWTTLSAGATVGLVQGSSTVLTIMTLKHKIDPKSAGFTRAGVALGAIGVVASTAATVASGIQLGRTVSSGLDIKRSRTALDEKKKAKNPISTDEKTLDRFLTHQQRDVSRQKASKSVAFVNSGIGTFSAISAMTGVLAPLSIVGGIISFVGGEIWNKIVDRAWRNSIIKKAVDEKLGLNDLVAKLKQSHSNKAELSKMKDDDLKNIVRDEAMANYGFTSFKSYFKHVCTEFAKLLYNKVFEDTEVSEKDRNMYEDALKSLGMKIKKPKPGKKEKGVPYPPVNAIVTKLMG